jgi:hypothetical protein
MDDQYMKLKELMNTQQLSAYTGMSASFFEKGRIYGYPSPIAVRAIRIACDVFQIDHECHAPPLHVDLHVYPWGVKAWRITSKVS